MNQNVQKLLNVLENEIGYLEKKSNSDLYDKTANAGSKNITKYWNDVYPQFQGQPWCAAFVTWCFDKAFGKENTKKLLKHYPYTYVPTLANAFTRYANPRVGDIVMFYRNGEFCHTGVVTKVSGDYFETIEGNTSGSSAIVANGGGVYKKSYYNSKLLGTKFMRPDYTSLPTQTKEEEDMTQEKFNEMMDNWIAKQSEIPPDWEINEMNWAIEKGLIIGGNEGYTYPKKFMTRGELVTVLKRLVDKANIKL